MPFLFMHETTLSEVMPEEKIVLNVLSKVYYIHFEVIDIVSYGQ